MIRSTTYPLLLPRSDPPNTDIEVADVTALRKCPSLRLSHMVQLRATAADIGEIGTDGHLIFVGNSAAALFYAYSSTFKNASLIPFSSGESWEIANVQHICQALLEPDILESYLHSKIYLVDVAKSGGTLVKFASVFRRCLGLVSGGVPRRPLFVVAIVYWPENLSGYGEVLSSEKYVRRRRRLLRVLIRSKEFSLPVYFVRWKDVWALSMTEDDATVFRFTERPDAHRKLAPRFVEKYAQPLNRQRRPLTSVLPRAQICLQKFRAYDALLKSAAEGCRRQGSSPEAEEVLAVEGIDAQSTRDHDSAKQSNTKTSPCEQLVRRISEATPGFDSYTSADDAERKEREKRGLPAQKIEFEATPIRSQV